MKKIDNNELYAYANILIEQYKGIHNFAKKMDGYNAFVKDKKQMNYKDAAEVNIVTPNSDTIYTNTAIDLSKGPVIFRGKSSTEMYISILLYDLEGTIITVDNFITGGFILAKPGQNTYIKDRTLPVILTEGNLVAGIGRTQVIGTDVASALELQSHYNVTTIDGKKMVKIDKATYNADALTGSAIEKAKEIIKFNYSEEDIESSVWRKTLMNTNISDDEIKAIEKTMKEQYEKLRVSSDVSKILTSTFGEKGYSYGSRFNALIGIKLGQYGLPQRQACYELRTVTDEQNPKVLDGSLGDYVINVPLPAPANAFWSVTMYDNETKLFYDNPLNRYLVNPSMVTDSSLKEINIVISNAEPTSLKNNEIWLPTPNKPFYLTVRVYAPKPEYFTGDWKATLTKKVN